MRSPYLVCLPLAVVLGSCAITPMPVAGPSLSDGAWGPAIGWAASHGPSQARVRDPQGGTHVVNGNGDSYAGVPTSPGVVMPVYALFRGPLVPGLEGRAQLGPFGAGLGARLRLTEPGGPVDLFASVDGQAGYAFAYGDGTLFRLPAYAGRVLLEGVAPLGRRLQLLGALGLSAGRFRHGVDVYDAMDNTNRGISDNPFPTDFIALVRPELRLEAAIGGAVVTRWVGVELAVLPYVVLVSGTARGECRYCMQGMSLEAYSQSYGVMVMVQPFAILGRKD